MPLADAFQDLTLRLREAADIHGAIGLLDWDQETYMPPKAVRARARQRATLSAIAHAKLIDAETGRLLDMLESDEALGQLGDTQRAIVRETRYDFERARRLPERLVRELEETTAIASSAWADARQRSDFAAFAPHLEKIMGLLREKAEAYGYADSPYDALIEDYERGMTAAALRPIFARLRAELTPMIQAMAGAPGAPSRAILEKPYDSQKQWDFGMRVLKAMGFDLEAGRQDKSAHPFTGGSHPTDVRLTTRIAANDLASGLFSTIHEGGHGLYEQGWSAEHLDTPLAQAPSLGLHESQSRFWENQIGRSRSFWRHWFRPLAELFPEILTGIGADDFYRAINVVRPSLIRVEADEATYALHIILRFEIESALMQEEIRIAELPALWNAKMKELLGIEPPNDAQGVLQDIHWSFGLVGYFPTYALGTLYAAQLFKRLRECLANVDDLLEAGEMAPILQWLRTNVHSQGRAKTAEALIAGVCGESLNARPFLDYIRAKYGEIYRIEL